MTFRLRTRRHEKLKFFTQLSVCVICAVILLQQYARVSAIDNTINWLSGTPSIEKTELAAEPTSIQSPTNISLQRDCTMQHIEVVTGFGQTESGNACVVTGKYLRFAIYNAYTPVVSFGNDTKMYKVSGLSTTTELVARTDTILQRYYYWQNKGTQVYTDFATRLKRDTTNITYTSYVFDGSNPLYTTKQLGTDRDSRIFGSGYSKDGRYIAWSDTQEAGMLFKILDTATGNVRAFDIGSMDPTYENYYYGLTVSNDGRYVAGGTGGSSFQVWDTKNCGYTLPIPNNSFDLEKRCPFKNIENVIDKEPNTYYPLKAYGYEFSDDNGQISLYAGTPFSKWYSITVSATGYTASRLDYLALGDSFSSGEGDTAKDPKTGNKYYRDWTDNKANALLGLPEEKCHISTRSYPYLLARSMNLALDSPKQWDTIACSGAQIPDVSDPVTDNSRYLGQGERLKGYDSTTLKQKALNELIPGRNQQIEFVKKYKPKVITLTMGGNDVGFGDKVRDCIAPSTCDFAKEPKISQLGKQIKNLYGNLKDLYSSIYDASGQQSKIFVLGYPKLVSDDNELSCGGKVLYFNLEERKMINEATDYMNLVIAQAAKASGVKYIDISKSLNGHRLCEDGYSYVTNVRITPEDQSGSFHPNAKGHEQISIALWDSVGGQSLLDYDNCLNTAENICPDLTATKDKIIPPIYFQTDDSQTDAGTHYAQITQSEVTKGSVSAVTRSPFTFQPGTQITRTLHSDPIDLGTVMSNDEGGTQESVTMPQTVPVGYHTLTISGSTYSGEPISYEQVVLVKGSNPADIDEDGVNDKTDPCLFIPAANIDADKDGIDDACDPEITQPLNEIITYHARLGDAKRTYNGKPENITYIYIERNIAAADATNIYGDTDPDNDGWAIVGVSSGKPYSTKSIPDTGPIANFIVTGSMQTAVPHVYIRAGQYGCVEYTPASLAKVEVDKTRLLKQGAVNTDKCRSADPKADIDKDGKPDNSQPLYVARAGDKKKGEDPKLIYLYRSFYAAEAQLGISDYSPTGTAAGSPMKSIQLWNQLAGAKLEKSYKYHKLVILKNDKDVQVPTIVTRKSKGKCIAYQPSQSSVTSPAQTKPVSLVKLKALPKGVGCI